MSLKRPVNYQIRYENKGIVIECSICGKEVLKRSPVQKYCSDCAREMQREQARERQRHLTEDQKRAKYEHLKTRYRNNPEYRKGRKEYAKRYYLENKERFMEYQKEYQREYQKEYRERNRDLINLKRRIRRCCGKHGGIDNCPYPDCIKE